MILCSAYITNGISPCLFNLVAILVCVLAKIARRLYDISKILIPECFIKDKIHVIYSHKVVRVLKTVRIYEVRMCCSKRLRLLVHKLSKGLHGSADALCYCDGGIIPARKHEPV